MTWYAAHLIEYFELKEGGQTTYPVWESVLLIKAQSPQHAFDLAKTIGEERNSQEDQSWTSDGKAASKVFGGVRRIVECDLDDPDKEVANLQPTHGTEVTYVKLEVTNREDLEKLISGKSVNVQYMKVAKTEDD